MMMAITTLVEPLVSTADSPADIGDMGGGGDGEGGGGGGMPATVGGVTTSSTTIETPVTLASMPVALLGLLVAMAIIDCTEVAVTVYVWMLTSAMTLPGDTATSTADGSTLALAAIAPFISVRTLGVNEETSPASSRVTPPTLLAGGDGHAAALFHFEQGIEVVRRHGFFEPEDIKRLERAGDAHGGGDIESAMTFDEQIDLVADGIFHGRDVFDGKP
jgi:hypothetical protein